MVEAHKLSANVLEDMAEAQMTADRLGKPVRMLVSVFCEDEFVGAMEKWIEPIGSVGCWVFERDTTGVVRPRPIDRSLEVSQ